MRVERTQKEIAVLIQDAEKVIRASLPELRQDRRSPYYVKKQNKEVRSRAMHLVHYCLDKPVSENG